MIEQINIEEVIFDNGIIKDIDLRKLVKAMYGKQIQIITEINKIEELLGDD